MQANKKLCRMCGKFCGCPIKYRECFVPTKTPRLIKCMVKREVWREDLNHYNVHLKRIYNAKPLVDTYPPKINVNYYLRRIKLIADQDKLLVIKEENKRLLRSIIEIDRKGGCTDNINQYALKSVSNWKRNRDVQQNIKADNKKMHKLLCNSKPYYSKKVSDTNWIHLKKQIQHMCRFPVNIMKKTSLDTVLKAEPSISGNLEHLIQRPLCFMEFNVEDGTYLGRIIIELYHDVMPVTVQNFLSLIRGEYNGLTYKNCPIHRIVKERFLETGDITKGTGKGGFSIYGKYFDEEKHKLFHTKAGVLTMVRIGGKEKNNSKFCITLMNMEEWDKKNSVFGKIIYGADVLVKINGYGRVIGKPLKKVFISNCGDAVSCTKCKNEKK